MVLDKFIKYRKGLSYHCLQENYLSEFHLTPQAIKNISFTNSTDPDETAHNELSQLDLCCLTFSLSISHLNFFPSNNLLRKKKKKKKNKADNKCRNSALKELKYQLFLECCYMYMYLQFTHKYTIRSNTLHTKSLIFYNHINVTMSILLQRPCLRRSFW